MAGSRYTVSLVFLTFFVISLLTNILGPIVPDYDQQLSRPSDCRGISGFRFLHCLRGDVHPWRFLSGTIHRKTCDGAGFLGGNMGDR
jgi:hypothetical protein